MKNLFKNTEFIFGVTDYKKLPEDVGYEILLAGRSNAGKSSALNALTKNKKLARISKTPGRTTEINFFKVNDDLMLLDLPGYGFAKSSKAKKKDWGPLLGQYFQKREALAAVIIFMDIRHPLKESDWEMIHLCRNFNIPCIPVLTKSDKLYFKTTLIPYRVNTDWIEQKLIEMKDILNLDETPKIEKACEKCAYLEGAKKF